MARRARSSSKSDFSNGVMESWSDGVMGLGRTGVMEPSECGVRTAECGIEPFAGAEDEDDEEDEDDSEESPALPD